MAYTAIDDPSAHFHIQLWTGDDNADRLITNDANAGDFRPDLLWLKNRSSSSSQCIFDSLRLASSESTVMLRSNNANAEEDKVDRFGGFETDGFTVDGNDVDTNADGDSFVAWQWKANGGTRVTNTESGNNPAGGYQVNTTAGFSIVDYTGTGATGTMAHGLGAVPEFLIIKNRARNDNWRVGSDFLSGWNYNIAPDIENAEWSNTGVFNSTGPTSSVFTVGSDGATNADGEACVAYLFKSIQGFSKSGKYTGNNDADGPFVYTGFRPAYLLIKNTSLANTPWMIFDNKRTPSNPSNKNLEASDTVVEDTTAFLDLYSNGFKPIHTSSYVNNSPNVYIYLAFAHQPFVTSGGVPCTAV